jgi:uncharacterized membrane protein YdjX (TVP38/TMEM64 family)
MTHRSLKTLLITGAFFIGVYGALVLALRSVGLEPTQAWIQEQGGWAPVVFVLICAASLIIAPLSGSSLFVAGGVLFGEHMGFALSFTASLVGCTTNYWISRCLGRKVASALVGKQDLEKLDQWIGGLGRNSSILYMCLLMPLSQDVVSYAVGLTSISFWPFFIALTVSGFFIVGGYVYVGGSLLKVLIGG